MKAPLIDAAGERGEVELPDEIFAITPNLPVLHEVVRGALAAARSGTHSTKTRAEVRGGGAKPWRQKGTGRARQGSIRAPQWSGGGVVHGPKPRDHSFRVNRKAKRLALRSALSDRAAGGRVLVVEIPSFEEPETKKAVDLLARWEVEGRVLIVTGRDPQAEINAWKSFRNLPEVDLVTYATPYWVLRADTVVLSRPALTELVRGPDES